MGKGWWIWGCWHSNPPEGGETPFLGAPRNPSDSVGMRFEGTEICFRDLSLLQVSVGCGSAFFPSPRQASSWRWRRLPPRGGASPPWARGPPRCRDPGSLRPEICRRLSNAEARLVRHLRAPEAKPRLPAAGLLVSHRQGLGFLFSLVAKLRETGRRGKRGFGTPVPSHLCAAPRSLLTWMPRTLSSFHHCHSTATPASNAHWPPTSWQARSWAPSVQYRAQTRIHSTLM